MAEQKASGVAQFVAASTTLLQWFGDAANLALFISVTGVGTVVSFLLPFDWRTPVPWLLTIFAMAVTVAVFRVGRHARHRFLAWKNPPFCTVVIDGGGKASLTLKHSGHSAKYSATGRIYAVPDQQANPAPQLFQCELLLRGKGSEPTITMSDGDWAQIVLASIGSNNYDRTWLQIRRGKYGVDCVLPGASAIVEIVLKIDPPPIVPLVPRFYKIRRIRDGAISVEDVTERIETCLV